MISKRGRFIFFHIPRTGGSSVQDCLWGGRSQDNNNVGNHPRENPDYYGPYDWHLHGLNPQENSNEVEDVVGHIGQGIYDWNTNFLAQDSNPYSLNYGKEKFNEYFKFTFVRNPWDRFISLWMKFKEEPKLQEQFNGLFDLHIDTDFKEPQEVLRYLLLAHKKGIMIPRWFKPQYEYIHDENLKVLTNYVGTYEKFQFCFDFLCDRIDIPHKTLPWGGEEHRRHNKEGKHYMDYYDPVMINAVAEIYHNDIRTWKYEF
tara:strand:+ start:63 stop:836 length:774 start_codon:yes stop_codon:yes gene_type:complete